jgi:hypothetical protein
MASGLEWSALSESLQPMPSTETGGENYHEIGFSKRFHGHFPGSSARLPKKYRSNFMAFQGTGFFKINAVASNHPLPSARSQKHDLGLHLSDDE